MKISDYQIRNLDVYVDRMQKSVLDKMFFIDKVFDSFANIVDFGCANGELIKNLQNCFGTYRYIGYDISADMINAAKNNVPTAEFTADWDKICVNFEDSLLNISSTIHEVYSYCSHNEVEEFWKKVFESEFKYIAIRDMMLSDVDKFILNSEQYQCVINNKTYADQLKDYQGKWGEISTQHDLVHYLLKYKYTENWEREVRENYLPITIEQLLKMIPECYEITYQDHFTLPYIAWQIKNDFGFEFNTKTHVKLILRRKY